MHVTDCGRRFSFAKRHFFVEESNKNSTGTEDTTRIKVVHVAEVEGFNQTVLALTRNIRMPTQETVKPKDAERKPEG